MMLNSCLLLLIITNFIATSARSTTLDQATTIVVMDEQTNLDKTDNTHLFTIRLSIQAIIIFAGCVTLCIVCTIGCCCAWRLYHRYNQETTKEPMDSVLKQPHIIYGSSPSAAESNANLEINIPKHRPQAHTIDFPNWSHNAHNNSYDNRLSLPQQRHMPSVHGHVGITSSVLKDGLSHLGLSLNNLSSAPSLAPPILHNNLRGLSGSTASSVSVSASDLAVLGANTHHFDMGRKRVCTLNDIAINSELPKSPRTNAQSVAVVMAEIRINEEGNSSDSASEIYIKQPQTPQTPQRPLQTLQTVSKPMEKYID